MRNALCFGFYKAYIFKECLIPNDIEFLFEGLNAIIGIFSKRIDGLLSILKDILWYNSDLRNPYFGLDALIKAYKGYCLLPIRLKQDFEED